MVVRGRARCLIRTGRLAACSIGLVALVLPAVAATAGATEPSTTSTASSRSTEVVQESTRRVKIGLINQLTQAPYAVFFGSSRAMRVAPEDYRAMTGRTAFNAAVSSGSIADVYCFSQLIHNRFPDTKRYVWFLDIEQLRHKVVNRAIFAQPELAAFIPAGFPSPYAGLQLPTAGAPPSPPPQPWGKVDVIDADGFLRWNRYDYQRLHSRTLKKGVAYSRWLFTGIYPRGFPRMYGTAKWFMDRTLRMMDRWGAYPVIVLTPYHPSIHKYISARGYSKRYRQVWNYLKRLQRKGLHFAVLNMTQIQRFGGWPHGFYDGTHMRRTMSRVLLQKVVELTHGLLR